MEVALKVTLTCQILHVDEQKDARPESCRAGCIAWRAQLVQHLLLTSSEHHGRHCTRSKLEEPRSMLIGQTS